MISCKRMYRSAMLLSMALIPQLFLASGIQAATGDTEEAFTLGEVVVTAKNGGVEATQAVNEVTAEDIKARNARTLDEAIELLPGLNVRSGGEGVPRIDIRGLRTRHVLLLLDGIPINSAADQQFDPTFIPVENIAKIKLTVGPSSVLYGQGGLAGVINIITKKGTKTFRGTASYEAGDRQEYLFRSSVGGSKDKFDFFLSGSAYKQTSFPLSDNFDPTSLQDKGYRKNSDHERNNVFGNFGFQATEDLNLALTFNYLQGEYGKPSSIIPNTPNVNQTVAWNLSHGRDIFASSVKYQRVEDLEGFSVQLAGDYTPSGPFSLRTWAFYNQLDQNELQYTNSSFTTLNSDYDVTSRIMGLAIQPKFDLGRGGAVTAGFAVEGDKWENDDNMGTSDLTKRFDIYSLSLQYEVEPVKNLGLVVGYGHYWQDRSKHSDDDFSVMAGAHYDLFTGTRIKAAFQRNIRFPSLEQLYSTSGGNDNLKTERTYQYEIGLEQKLPGNSIISLTGFRTDAKNFIEKDSTDTNRNFQKYRFYGFEVAAQTRFIDNLVLRTSYSYMDSKDRSADATKDELQYRPKNKYTFEGWYDFSFGLTPYVSVQYVSDQVTYDRIRASQSIAYKMNDYTLVNVKLSQRFLKNRLNVYFGVNNIFDDNYETSYGYPQEGRFIYGGVGVSI